MRPGKYMTIINIIEKNDYLHFYEMDFSNDDWVGQEEMNKLYSMLCCYLNKQLGLQDIENGICHKVLQSGNLKIKIFNDSACYWLDVMVIVGDQEINVILKNVLKAWIDELQNSKVV